MTYLQSSESYIQLPKYNDVNPEEEKQKENKKPVIELDVLLNSIPLPRDQVPFSVRGFCIPGLGYGPVVHDGDRDVTRVNYHENLHMRIYKNDPNHEESYIRMLEDWRLGYED